MTLLTPPAIQTPTQKATVPQTPPSPPVPPVADKPIIAAGTEADVLPDQLLINILSTRRAHNSVGDANFRVWLIAEIKKTGHAATIAKEGSLIVQTDKKSTTMFSCHIDTCHGKTESDGSKQDLSYDPVFGHIFLTDKKNSGCLGGDDGVGVYLMLKMMKARIKGTYVFHTGEECGGIGSRALLAERRSWVAGFDRCIAFDRAVKHGESPEVVITQGGQSCASQAFGAQMVVALNEHKFEDPWVISHGGSFTDSKVYSEVVSECINLGCFYVAQHSPNEVVDYKGVEDLLAACLKIKWQDLKPSRTPTAELPPPPAYAKGGFGGYSGYGGYGRGSKHGFDDLGDMDDLFERDSHKVSPLGNRGKVFQQPDKPKLAAISTTSTMFEDVLDYSKNELIDFIDHDSAVAVDIMCLLIAKYKGLQLQAEVMERLLGN